MNLAEIILLTLALYIGAYTIFSFASNLWWLGLIMAGFAVLLTIRVAGEILFGDPSSS